MWSDPHLPFDWDIIGCAGGRTQGRACRQRGTTGGCRWASACVSGMTSVCRTELTSVKCSVTTQRLEASVSSKPELLPFPWSGSE